MDTPFILLALAAGALLAIQAGANAQLAKATGSPFAATTLQLAVGALLLLFFTFLSGTISALSPRARRSERHAGAQDQDKPLTSVYGETPGDCHARHRKRSLNSGCEATRAGGFGKFATMSSASPLSSMARPRT